MDPQEHNFTIRGIDRDTGQEVEYSITDAEAEAIVRKGHELRGELLPDPELLLDEEPREEVADDD